MDKFADKFAYFNPPDLQGAGAAPPPSWGELWGEGLSLLDIYCERAAAGWWQEPLNTWSSLFFLLAAFAGYLVYRRSFAPSSARDRTRLMLCLNLSAIGVASWTFHASGLALFALLDALVLLIFMLRASFALLVRGLAFKAWQACGGVVAIFALAPLFSYLPFVGERLQGGNVYFSAILALGLIALGIGYRANIKDNADLSRSARGLGVAFVVLVGSLTIRSLDLPLCAEGLGEWSYGTHFLWHTLNAVALFLLVVFLPRRSS